MDWIDMAQDRDQWRVLVNTVMNLRDPLNAGKFFSSCTTGDSSRRAYLHGVIIDSATDSPQMKVILNTWCKRGWLTDISLH
jgi:hypothetical protein